MKCCLPPLMALLAVMSPQLLFAQSPQTAPAGPPNPAPPIVTRINDRPVSFADLPPPRRFVSRHETMIKGERIRYTATAGETYITNLQAEPIARFFSFSYVKDGPRDPSRPVMFVFNGGPGSASLWLHMGVIGPRRLVLDQEVNPSLVPPFGLQANPHSPLDVADLVFIDPVGTGFSQAVGNARNTDFFGVDEDAESVARFIEAWLTENGRWNSPKYLMGESYGSFRAAILPRTLMGSPLHSGVMRGITIDGIVLLGVVLNAPQSAPPAVPPSAPDPRVGLGLPAMAATAFHFGKVAPAGRSLESFHAEVSRFAMSDYAQALHQLATNRLAEEDKMRMAERLAAYTGLPASLWAEHDLKLTNPIFQKALLADRGLEIGAYDSRYTMPLSPTYNDPIGDDPAMGRYVPGFVASFHEMLTQELGVRMPIPYSSITWAGLLFNWNWNRTTIPPGQTPAMDLAVAMRRNPDLKVLVASGYFDLVTTAASAEYQVRSTGLPPERTTIRNYESGHMLYLGDTAERFADDVRALIAARRK